jgi:hypothetical protein
VRYKTFMVLLFKLFKTFVQNFILVTQEIQ